MMEREQCDPQLGTSHEGHNEAQNLQLVDQTAEDIIRQTERFKAVTELPRGNQINQNQIDMTCDINRMQIGGGTLKKVTSLEIYNNLIMQVRILMVWD